MSKLAYIQLMSSLDPGKGNIKNPMIRTIISEIGDFSKNANKKVFKKKGTKLNKLIEPIITHYQQFAPLKTDLESISFDFNELCKSNKEIYSTGIEYQWLEKRMDCSKMGFPTDLPYHTRVGLAHNAGSIAIQEKFLLEDAYFMLETSEQSFIRMNEFAEVTKLTGNENNHEYLKGLLICNHNVAAFSRISIIAFFSFIEAFVNSVGYDFILRNKNKLTAEQIDILNGVKKGRYLTLEYKIEKFPSIIRDDKLTTIILSDPSQIKEPFKSFIDHPKNIRDSSVHNSPTKVTIWQKPQDWINDAQSTARLCIQVASEFWKSCYPNRKLPVYLFELNQEILINIARERITNEGRFPKIIEPNSNKP